MKTADVIALAVAGGLLLLSLGTQTPLRANVDAPPAGDVLPFRILYGNPGKIRTTRTTCYLWSEGGRLHLRITPDGTAHDVTGALEVRPEGVLKDVSFESSGFRIRQPLPSLLQFDVRTQAHAEELSVVLAGDVEILRIALTIDGKTPPEALRIGERQEQPKALPADLALTGYRASWIERFGFN